MQTDPATLDADLPSEAWQALSAGEGAKGQRLYHWARIPLSWTGPDGFERWLLVRRNLKDPGELARYFAFVRTGTPLAEMAAAAFLAKLAASQRRAAWSKRDKTSPNPTAA